MFAVAVFTTPRIAKDSFATFSINYLIPRVAPYLQMTSQWQLWDLFAPDPLRRITGYRIEKEVNGTWQTVTEIDASTYPWYQHSTRFKYYINVLEGSDDVNAAKRQFLALQCNEWKLPADTHVRILYRIWIIPHLTSIPVPGYWKQWAPNVEEKIGPSILCPATDA